MGINKTTHPVLDQLDEPTIVLNKKKRLFCFILLYALFMSDFIARTGVNAIFPVLQADLNLTDTQIGTLSSIVLLGMAVFVLPVSFLGERYSPKKAINLSALVWSVGSILSGVTSAFFLLALSRFFVGTGNAAYAPLSNSMITSMYKKAHWGKMIGLYNTAMTFGGAAGALVFANLAGMYGWRAAFIVVGVISLILTAMSLFLPENKKQAKKESSSENRVNVREAVGTILKNKSLLMTCLGAGLSIMPLQAVITYSSIYYVRECGMAITTAAALVGASSLIAAFAYPIGGTIMDIWYKKDKRSRVFLPAIGLSICAIFHFVGFKLQLVPILMIAPFFYTLGNTGVHTASQELVPSWFKSVAYGVYVLFIQLLGAVGPVCAGILSDSLGLTNALIVIQVLFVVASIVLIIAGLLYMKDFQEARQKEMDAAK